MTEDQAHEEQRATERWTVELFVDRVEPSRGAGAAMLARARLMTGPGGVILEGTGTAKIRSRHPQVERIGRELAVARALTDLSHQVCESAATEEAVIRGALRP